MATCNASTLTLFGLRGMSLPLIVQSADMTSRLQRITHIANAGMEQYDTVHTAKNVALRAKERIGHDLFMWLSLRLMHRSAKFATLKNHLLSFTQTDVLPTGQKSTVADAKTVCLHAQNRHRQKHIHQKHKSDQQAIKISFLAYSTTPQKENSTLGLILILGTCFNFTRNSRGVVPCLELK